MRMILAFFFLLTSFFAPNGYTQEKPIPFPQGDFKALKRTGNAEVISIIDPQTVQLHDGRIIRLSGVEFPDLGVHEAGDFSVTAIKVLEDMLLGQGVNIYQTKKKDWGRTNRMGHHIAHLERIDKNIWIQGSLLSFGLARVRTTQRTPEMAEQMYKLEGQARNGKTGIWEAEEFAIRTTETAPEHLDSLQIVEGTIESTALKNNRIYLNFGKDWKTDFTVSIAPKDKRLFSKLNLDPLQWGGRRVRVRGWLRSYNGPYMEINHPQAIEFLETSAPKPLPETREGSKLPRID